MNCCSYYKLLAICSLWIFSAVLSAQNQDNGFYGTRFNAKQWTGSDGLPLMVQAMAQTKDGSLWIGTESGLYRFDGHTVTFFNRHTTKSLIEDDCGVLYVARDSSLYCGMYNGLLCRYKNSQFDVIGNKTDFNSKTIKGIVEDRQGCLWIATYGAGLIKYQNKKFTTIGTGEGLASMKVGCLSLGSGDDIWMGTTNGLYQIRDGKIRHYGGKDGIDEINITTLYLDSSGALWIGSKQGAVIRYLSGKFEKFKELNALEGTPINAFHESQDGFLWILTRESGIVVFNPGRTSMTPVDNDLGQSGYSATSIITSQEGDIIIGTQGNSILRLRNNLLKSFTTLDGLPDNAVMAIFKARNGDIWVGSESGKIACYRKGRFLDMSSRFGIVGAPVFSIGGGKDNWIWVGTYGKLVGSDGTNRKVINAGLTLPNTMFHAVYVARDGTLWAGTDEGILMIKDGQTRKLSLSDGLSDVKIFCFLEAKDGSMWVGTQEGGINVVNKGIIKTISRKEGLSDNMILCMYEDSTGAIWVGTGHDGLNHIDGKTGKITQLGSVLSYLTAITHIEEDQNGKLWIGTNGGILGVKRSELEAFIAGGSSEVRLTLLGPAEGVVSGDCPGGIFPAGCSTSDGMFWFTTLVGIAEVDPKIIGTPSYHPRITIQELIVNNEQVQISDNCILPAGVMDMEIKYTAPSFINPANLEFRYKLEGYDQQWVAPTIRRSAFYGKLPPGDYVFNVQVMNHYGQWDEKSTTLRIHINSYFYQSSWFIALCILLVITLFYLFLKYRLKQVREKELEHLVLLRTEEIRKLNDELEQKVIDRTAQLGATNAELEAFSYSVSHDLKAPVRRIEALIGALQEDYGDKLDSPAQDFLVKISESIGTMSLLIDELLKLSRIARQEIERTDVNLSSMSVKILEKLKGIYPDRNVIFNVQPDLVVDCDARLIQIALQNLLDNAWKYTGQKEFAEISITAELQDGKTVVVIHDNGVGFDMNHYNKLFTPFQRLHSDDQFTGTGIGLATVRRIIQKHGGAIWAESQPGSGTSFFFTLK